MEIVTPIENSGADNSQNPHLQSYNMFLYKKRLELGLSRFRFARLLHIPWIRYRFIENGYMKPTKREVQKISDALHMDFAPHVDGMCSYPEELPDRAHGPVSAFFYRLMGKLWLRITLGTLVVAGVASFITSNCVLRYAEEHPDIYYSTTYVQYFDEIKKNGAPAISILEDFITPQIVENVPDDHMYVIHGGNTYSSLGNVKYVTHFWTSQYRVSFTLISAQDNAENPAKPTLGFQITVVDYNTSTLYRGFAGKTDSCLVSFYSINGEFFQVEQKRGTPEWEAAEAIGVSYLENNDFLSIFVNLANEKLGTNFKDFQKDMWNPMQEGTEKKSQETFVYSYVNVLSFILGLAFLFAFLYALLYGEKKERPKVFNHDDILLGFGLVNKPMKKDIRFSPFLPETFFEILGILLIAIGSLRILVMMVAYVSPNSYSSEMATYLPNALLSIYFMGMFLLYFIDFDLFLDDRRVQRNIALYFIVFLGLYYIEASVMTSLAESGSIVFTTLTQFFIPNNFMSATCYFLIMFFLFFTPNKIKTKRGLILFRACALLPILYIAVSFIIGHGDVFFGWKMNLWVKYWFSVERMPFSVLCVLYLVGLFFLRLFFKKKYGEEGAKRFINGNRFLFIKNAMLCSIILIVWIIELFFAKNKAMNDIGIGNNTLIIFLIPLLMFYHPHKGPRNLALDWFTLIIYAIALSYVYLIAGIYAIAAGLLNSLIF